MSNSSELSDSLSETETVLNEEPQTRQQFGWEFATISELSLYNPDRTRYVENPVLVEELQGMFSHGVPLHEFMSLVFPQQWANNERDSRYWDSAEFRMLCRSYNNLVPLNKEKILYEPFANIANAVFKRFDVLMQFLIQSEQPVEGTTAIRKPDGVIVHRPAAAFYDVKSHTDWNVVYYPVEFKVGTKAGGKDNSIRDSNRFLLARAISSELARKSAATPDARPALLTDQEQLASYILEVLSCTGYRQHGLGVFIQGGQIQMWYLDHMGCIGSDLVDFTENRGLLGRILLTLGQATYDQIGYIPCLRPRAKTPGGPRPPHGGATHWEIVVADSAYPIIEHLHRDCGIYGNGTNVFTMKNPLDSSVSVMKLSWPLSSRMSERDLLTDAHNRGISNVPKVVDSFSAGELPGIIRQSLWNAIPDPTGQFNPDRESRTLRVIIMTPLCAPLYKITEPGKFLEAFRSLITTHWMLFSRAKILHRDINPFNLMVNVETNEGILIDLNTAMHTVAERINVPTSVHRKGLIPFIALDLLVMENQLEHAYRHDLESFAWSLIWILLHYEDGKFVGVLDSRVQDWYTGEYDEILREKNKYRKPDVLQSLMVDTSDTLSSLVPHAHALLSFVLGDEIRGLTARDLWDQAIRLLTPTNTSTSHV